MAIDETFFSTGDESVSNSIIRVSLPNTTYSSEVCVDSMVQFNYVLLTNAGKPTGMPDKYYVTSTNKYTE